LRSQYFHDEGDGITFYEKAIRYAKFQENENSSQVSLFGKVVMFKLLNRSYHLVRTGALWKTGQEKEVVGIYISGHPLDDYKFEMKFFVMLSSKH
jgi:DNA polymerase-3 subunit alpha